MDPERSLRRPRTAATAAFTAVFDLVPDLFPFFAPAKGPLTDRADFLGQIGLEGLLTQGLAAAPAAFEDLMVITLGRALVDFIPVPLITPAFGEQVF
jgi:hypothetical protein